MSIYIIRAFFLHVICHICLYNNAKGDPQQFFKMILMMRKLCAQKSGENEEIVGYLNRTSDETRNITTCQAGLDPHTLCWTESSTGTIVEQDCHDMLYLSGRTQRSCSWSGVWSRPDVSQCVKRSAESAQEKKREFLVKYGLATQKEVEKEAEVLKHDQKLQEVALILRYVDGSICIVGLLILTYLIPLKNLRFLLHRNLIFTFFLYDVSQIITKEILTGKYNEACTYFFFCTQYIFLCQIAWMFNEAFFHFRQFFFVFVTKKYVWAYFLFGYGFPAVITFGIYVPVIWSYPPINGFAICWDSFNSYKWNNIIYGTAYILLILNFLIVIYILVIIWRKLESSTDTEKAKKTARGFIVLSILLGGGYICAINGPHDSIAWLYFRIIVNPTQGILICIVHVVMSKEVRNAAFSRLRKFVQSHDSMFEGSTHLSAADISDIRSRVSSFMKKSIRKSPNEKYDVMNMSRKTSQMSVEGKFNEGMESENQANTIKK